MIELQDHERAIVYDRLLAILPQLEQSDCPEHRKLAAIGKLVEGILMDIHGICAAARKTVRPSLLPNHDDLTIEFLAMQQRILNSMHFNPSETALYLDRLEHGALIKQKEERP